MNEEFDGNLEITEEAAEMQEEMFREVLPQEDVKEEDIPENVHTESVGAMETAIWPGSVLTQAEDGSWRHAENSPFSPFYVPDRKQKSNNRLTIGLVVVLLFLLIAGLIFAVSKLIEAAVGEATVAWKESTGAIEDFFDDIKEGYNKKEAEVPVPDTYEVPDIQEFPDFLMPEEPEFPDNYEGNIYDDYIYEEEPYIPSPDDEYYVELANAIREDLSYSVDIKEYAHSDFDNSVYVTVHYAQVSDDVKNSDFINECLQESAMYYADMFASHDISDLVLEVETYVTYMDEEILSVVLDEYFYVAGETNYSLFCMNFDLKTGTWLNNTDVIKVSDTLVDAFVEQSIYQNGYTSSVSDYTNEEIADFMSKEESLILFYSPVGLEIGYNHPSGWVTATFKEYNRFLRKL